MHGIMFFWGHFFNEVLDALKLIGFGLVDIHRANVPCWLVEEGVFIFFVGWGCVNIAVAVAVVIAVVGVAFTFPGAMARFPALKAKFVLSAVVSFFRCEFLEGID